MKFKSKLIKPFANAVARQVDRWKMTAVADQEFIRQNLVKSAKNTLFGKENNFVAIKSAATFSSIIPLTDYELIRPYIEKIKSGESDVLWPGQPKYFAKTSGTTSGAKYIPLTKESMPNHFGTARNALLNYAAKSGNYSFFDGKMIFLSGSPVLDLDGVIPVGRLSGIVNHEIPAWLRKSQVPSYQTNCIDDWETKVDAIVKETIHKDMSLISGIPPWVQMYLERLLKQSGKERIIDLFPNLSVFVYGGVNFSPYRNTLENLFGRKIDSVETFPASEGFFAFQDEQGDEGMLLNTNSGIYFEFIESSRIGEHNPPRLPLEGVRTNIPYALVINNNAGLWGYNIGDIVTFISVDPYKIVFSGRVAHYISAFGEHVIAKEVEDALLTTSASFDCKVSEFSVAPQVNPPEGGLPYHEWFIEFDQEPSDINAFIDLLDQQMTAKNIYYKDLIEGHILQKLKLRPLKKGTFITFMKQNGKLGGQNKVPRLTNDRKIADALTQINNL